MSIKLVERKTGYNGCDNCYYFDIKIGAAGHSSYQLYGFCRRHVAYVTLIDDPEMPVFKCEGACAYRIYKK